MSDENVVVVEQGSSDAQKIAKAMSSPTASDLFNNLSVAPMSATALAEKTGLPLTTVKYHLGNLLDAGLIEIEKTRWSKKGREMKIYAIKNQVVILAPRKNVNVKGIIEKYGAVAGAIAVGCSLVLAIPQTLLQVNSGNAGLMETAVTGNLLMNDGFGVSKSVAPSAAAIQDGFDIVQLIPTIHTVVQGFLVTSLVILAGLMIYEICRTRHIR
ncbi:MAG: helix-turn-helix domain-containing protein [Methanocorpusculum sp.]|nr:helix-turn-helix domain-containing protein [Methanocorpusculum sp.]